jgi:hypothetical protein
MTDPPVSPPVVRILVDVSTGSGSAVVVCSCGFRVIVLGDRVDGLTAAAAHETTHHYEVRRLTASATRRLAFLTAYRRRDS